MNRILTATLLLLAALPPIVSGQIPPGYWVQQITDNNFQECPPRLNDRGQIVFERRSGPGGTGELFLYDRDSDTLTQLTDDDVVDAFPDISEDGTITWTRFIGPPGQFGPTGEIMIRDPDGTVTRLTNNAVEDRVSRINSQRHVAWKRYTGPGCGGVAMDIYFFDGQTTRAITTDGVPSNVANQGPSLNDDDDISWTRYDFCVNPWQSRVMIYSKGQIAEISVPDMFEPQGASINNQRQVTWSYLDQEVGDHRIVLWENDRSSFLTFGRGALLNDRGHVAFTQWHNEIPAWQPWLYRGGRLFRISEESFGVVSHDINESAEVVMLSGAFPDFDVRLLRRFELGDLNCDHFRNAFDIEGFLLALFDPRVYELSFPDCDLGLADTNSDGAVNAFDIEPFLGILFP